VGLEQEFFLVDEYGVLSNQADEFLALCREAAKVSGRDPNSFAPECAKSMVEINTPPVHSFKELSSQYLESLQLALNAGRELELRLYPLATYPLSVKPMIRDELPYWLQASVVGQDRFAHAGRCAGVHLHLQVQPGTTDPRVGVSYGTTGAAQEELLNLYNLATAFDAATIALTRSCPFYEGMADGTAMRTAHYRGDPDLAPYGLYAWLQKVGGLLPYADCVEKLVEQQFARYYTWLEAMDHVRVARQLFFEIGGSLLESSSWNPVRLNRKGTVELRGMDSNYPETIMAVSSLISSAAERVRQQRLAVIPRENLRVFEAAEDALFIPDFEYLSGELFRAALTEGVDSPKVASYLDSILQFANAGAETDEEIGFEGLKAAGRYRTTEADILQDFATPVTCISEERGLKLVCEACDELERQVALLRSHCEAIEATKVGANGD